MIVKNRAGDWVLRIYRRDPGEEWFVSCEQYYPTRAEMRKGAQLWKSLAKGSITEIKTKQYRIKIMVTGCSSDSGFFNTVMYQSVR